MAPKKAPKRADAIQLGRPQVAIQLGLTQGGVKRLEERGFLHPRKLNGLAVFDPAEVDALAASRREQGGATKPGTLAAACFSHFKAGVTVGEVVIRERIEPARALELFEQWRNMSSIMGLSASHLAALESLGVLCSSPAEIISSIAALRARARRPNGEA